MDPDDREFMRQLLRRHEKETGAMIAGLNANIQEMKALTRRFDAHSRKMDEDHREFIAEFRAQRGALFRILDRLDEGGSAAGA
jgi:hypothetical protein